MFSTREKHFGSDKTYYGGTLVLPRRCAVCDCEGAEPVSYVQGHFPIAIPGFGGVYRSTNVSIPYCKYHADAFQFRFRVLKILQYVIIAIAFPCLYVGFFMEEQKPAGQHGFHIFIVIGLFCWVVLLPASLIVRRFMYDAYFYIRPGCIQVKSKYQHFLDNLIAANPWLAEEGQSDETGNALNSLRKPRPNRT